MWNVASEQVRSVPRQRDAEVTGHLSVAREEPAGIRHAVAPAETTTECGLPLPALRVWDIAWPGDRRAIVCTSCAIAVVRATETLVRGLPVNRSGAATVRGRPPTADPPIG